MKKNQFKIAIGVGVAFLAIIVMVTLWVLSSSPQTTSQQASTSILSDIFGGRNNFHSYNNQKYRRRNNNTNPYDDINRMNPVLPVDPPDRKENLIWQKGGTCTDDGEGCSAKATCPSGYLAINCTINNSIVDSSSNLKYSLSVTDDQKTCQAEFKANTNPSNQSYEVRAFCQREELPNPAMYMGGYIGDGVFYQPQPLHPTYNTPGDMGLNYNRDGISWEHNSDGTPSPRVGNDYFSDYQQYLQDNEEWGSDL